MLEAMIVAVAWPGAGGGVEPLGRAFWIHQALAAAGTIVFLRWVRALAERSEVSDAPKVIRFPRRP
jgi:hypothetical protein